MALWSRDQDQDLDTLVSIPRPRPSKNELECTRVTRPWSRDHNTARSSKPEGLRAGVSFWGGAKPQPPRVLMPFVFSDDLSCHGKSCMHSASVSACNSDYSVTVGSIIFLPYFFCRPASVPSGARGPRFIEPLEPPVSTPLGEEGVLVTDSAGIY